MAIDEATRAEILRLFRVEGWPVGTIARQLGLHHSTVTRALQTDPTAAQDRPPRPKMIDPYLPFVTQTLARWPDLCASRLYQMVRERGYPGGQDHFRHQVALLRPRRPSEAFLRLRFLPGEQAQVDWAEFGRVTIGQGKRRLMAFVMTLSHSRQMFLRFYLDAQMSSFLHGHVAAFHAFMGVPRSALYDNLKSVVQERHGSAVVYNRTFLSFFRHYAFEPRVAAPYRGNEKGRVERSIRFIRESFFAARAWRDLDDLNEQASAWTGGYAADRQWPNDRTRRVREVFAEEQGCLIALPGTDYPVDDQVPVTIDKTCFARYDGNDYSVPHTYARRALLLSASLTTVRILDGSQVVASHARSFDVGAEIEDPAHTEALQTSKRGARRGRAQNRLIRAAPSVERLLVGAAERGDNIGSIVVALLTLLERYGGPALEQAVVTALERGVPHPNAVRIALTDQSTEPPPVPVTITDPTLRDLTVRSHDLADYDGLAGDTDPGDTGS